MITPNSIVKYSYRSYWRSHVLVLHNCIVHTCHITASAAVGCDPSEILGLYSIGCKVEWKFCHIWRKTILVSNLFSSSIEGTGWNLFDCGFSKQCTSNLLNALEKNTFLKCNQSTILVTCVWLVASSKRTQPNVSNYKHDDSVLSCNCEWFFKTHISTESKHMLVQLSVHFQNKYGPKRSKCSLCVCVLYMRRATRRVRKGCLDNDGR